MTEVWFYHLERTGLDQALPELLEKTLQRGWKAIVRSREADRVEHLDGWLWSYRDEGVFHEHVVNTICDDLVKVLDPQWIEVTGVFNARGGIGITVVAAHERSPRGKARR